MVQYGLNSSDTDQVKLMQHPGSALFAMALLALIVFLLAPDVALIGSLVRFVAFFTMIFGTVGGAFLAFIVRKGEAAT